MWILRGVGGRQEADAEGVLSGRGNLLLGVDMEGRAVFCSSGKFRCSTVSCIAYGVLLIATHGLPEDQVEFYF